MQALQHAPVTSFCLFRNESPVFKSFSRIHYTKHVCDCLSIRSFHWQKEAEGDDRSWSLSVKSLYPSTLAGEESFRQRPGRVGSTETQKDKRHLIKAASCSQIGILCPPSHALHNSTQHQKVDCADDLCCTQTGCSTVQQQWSPPEISTRTMLTSRLLHCGLPDSPSSKFTNHASCDHLFSSYIWNVILMVDQLETKRTIGLQRPGICPVRFQTPRVN